MSNTPNLLYLAGHFTLGELTASDWALRLGIDNTAPTAVLANLRRTAGVLEQIRALTGVPLMVSSGYRCLALNRALKSADTSAHVQGLAADFTAPPLDCRSLAERIVASDIAFDQCILEFGAWVHLGVAPSGSAPRREVLTAERVNGKTVYTRGLKGT